MANAKPESSESPKPQADKFRDLAREIGAHENAEVFEENLRRIVTAPKPEKKPDGEEGAG